VKLLFDTHAFIWWDSNPERLSSKVMTACNDPDNLLILSVVSVWEMQIKFKLGKLTFQTPLKTTIQEHQKNNNLNVLPVTLTHVLELDSLPLHHKDPFDRLLVAQAVAEDAVLLSRDPAISKYVANVMW
jgi:PIN domain nuclease of toxin-antitoxin system